MPPKSQKPADAPETALLTAEDGGEGGQSTDNGGRAGETVPERGSDGGEGDLAAQLAAAKAELAEVTGAAETAIGELKAERDRLLAATARLEGEAVEAGKRWEAAKAAYEAEIDDLREEFPERAARFAGEAGQPPAAPPVSDQAPAAQLESGQSASDPHPGPYVVMKTSSIVGADGQLVARNRVATGEPDRLRGLVEDDKARRATYAEVEAALAKDSVARLA